MKYVVVEVTDGYAVMERQQVGDVEVYRSVSTTQNAEQAGRIADALNAEERKNR